MKIQKIQIMAKAMGINTFRMKKTDMVRAIQRAEHNPDCFSKNRVGYCGELVCLWRDDCISLYNEGNHQK
jgi:hypothetical protein